MSEVKLFRLRRSKSTTDTLRAQKVELPNELATQGARTLRFSPDSKWLATADSKNSLYVDRITVASDEKITQVLKDRVHLGRIPSRQIQRKPYFGQHGSYEKSISHLAFSDDSRILVSASLDGKMNSWVLEGYEDLTQNGGTSLANGFANSNGDHGSDESDDDSEHDDDTQKRSHVILGQHWIRNPAPSFPLLPSAPLILSFRTTNASSTQRLTNGNISLHPTRHNAHPHSHDLPAGEDRLLVVTSEHGIYEYNTLTGKLSDWSRRNSSNLPSQFLRNRDRVKGSLWDVGTGRERLWLYGNSWLGMFDLSKDFPIEVPPLSKTAINETSEATPMVNGTSDGKHSSKKRKREKSPDDVEQTIPAKGSGAGGKAGPGDGMLGVKDEYRISHGLGSEQASYLQMLRQVNPLPSDEDPDDEDAAPRGGSSALVRLRRTGDSSVMPNGHLSDQHDSANAADEDGRPKSKRRKQPDHGAFWSTQRYRPILGIVPIGGEGEDEDGEAGEDVEMMGDASRERPATSKALEVALVERPLWDVDLPARLVDD